MDVKIHIRSPKMTPSQYIPMILSQSELQATTQKYEGYGYSVTILKDTGK